MNGKDEVVSVLIDNGAHLNSKGEVKKDFIFHTCAHVLLRV